MKHLKYAKLYSVGFLRTEKSQTLQTMIENTRLTAHILYCSLRGQMSFLSSKLNRVQLCVLQMFIKATLETLVRHLLSVIYCMRMSCVTFFVFQLAAVDFSQSGHRTRLATSLTYFMTILVGLNLVGGKVFQSIFFCL